jgi:integrase/recombinase XerC
MPKFPALHPTVRGWLLDGPLAEHVPAYLARLTEGRYASNTVARSLGALAHFAHWMALCRLSADRLDASRIEQFVGEHLPHCGCAGPAMRQPREAHAALMLLLALLRQRGVISDLPSPSGPIADELARYDARMRDARGLAAGTRRSQLRIVERLLLAKFAGRPFKFERLAPEDVRRFIAEQLELHNTTSNVLAINAALRGYLRWRGSCGDAVRPLLGVIVSPPHWSLASLPLALTSAQVDRVLNSFVGAGSLRTPKRGYAIVRLALDLGLRGAEINRMRLDDIDWRRGTITLRRTKSKREDVLPLPEVTGKALEDYICHERPATDERAVFVRRQAPRDQPLGIHAIRMVVRRAFRRAGIPHERTHALRHTLACRLVRAGSPIKEVADVLRHRSLNTSQIYAKLNVGALVEVALPWPGSTS